MISIQGSSLVEQHALFRSEAFHRYWSRELETMGTDQILHWTVDHFGRKSALATSFEPNGCVLVALLAKRFHRINVVETSFGYPLYETSLLKSMLQSKYHVSICCNEICDAEEKYYHFDTSPRSKTGLQRFLCREGFEWLRRTPAPYDVLICCDIREQLKREAHLPVMELDRRLNILKIYPLARWTKESLWNKIDRDEIPYSSFFENSAAFHRPPQRHRVDPVFDPAWAF